MSFWSAPMLETQITFFGKTVLCVCDGKCSKAWGLNGGRPQIALSDDPDDYAYAADGEVGEAPAEPGTWEGGHGKPQSTPERHNKWCVRECERSDLVDPGNPIVCRDFSRRFYNIPEQHGVENGVIETGRVFEPK